MAQMDIVVGKVSFVGDSGVGKTSIIHKYTQKDSQVEPTIGATAIQCSYTINGEEIPLNVWDTAGQEEYRSLLPMYVGMSNVVVIVYDVTRPSSWTSIVESWYEKLEGQVPYICIVGNKSDCEAVVKENDVADFCEAKEIEFMNTSAIEGSGITELFGWIAKKVAASGKPTPGPGPTPKPKPDDDVVCACNVC